MVFCARSNAPPTAVFEARKPKIGGQTLRICEKTQPRVALPPTERRVGPLLNHVDHAADGLRAKKHRRRAFYDLDAPDSDVRKAKAMLILPLLIVEFERAEQHEDAVAVQPPNDRFADALPRAEPIHACDLSERDGERRGSSLIEVGAT